MIVPRKWFPILKEKFGKDYSSAIIILPYITTEYTDCIHVKGNCMVIKDKIIDIPFSYNRMVDEINISEYKIRKIFKKLTELNLLKIVHKRIYIDEKMHPRYPHIVINIEELKKITY